MTGHENLYCPCGEAITVIIRDNVVTAYHLTTATTHWSVKYCPMCGVKLHRGKLVEQGELK